MKRITKRIISSVLVALTSFSMMDQTAVEGSTGIPVACNDGLNRLGWVYENEWTIEDNVTGFALDKTAYETGSEQSVNITYNVADLPSEDENRANTANTLYVAIVDSSFSYTGNDLYDFSEKGVITLKEIEFNDLKNGKNTLTMNVRFPGKGVYYLFVAEKGRYITEMAKIKFTVKAPAGSDGRPINTRAGVRPEFTVYSAAQAAKMKIFYTIGTGDSEYHLYVTKGTSMDGYAKDQKNIVADFMTAQGDLPARFGEEQSVTLNNSSRDFSIYAYTIVLYNMTTNKEEAKEHFYVVPEQYMIQRDQSKMDSDGKIPLYCDAKHRNFNMDKDEKYSFHVSFPLNYKKYLEELIGSYDLYGAPRDRLNNDDNPYLKDDYKVYMTVNYTPGGSQKSRKLFERTITGLYKQHTVELDSKEILKKIYETNQSDVSYAGVVTVEFQNKTSDKDGYQDIPNDAIIRFSESVPFGVYKTEKLTNLEAVPADVELAYGGMAAIKIKENLGGKIFADIYKGDKKIDSVKGTCSLDSDGTASGEVDWNLKDSSGEWSTEGEYTAKVYTVNDYKEFAEDGSVSDKEVKSDVKSVTFRVKKPDRTLTLSTSVSGISGGNAVYIEKPVIGVVVKTNIGVSVIVSVKNSKGVEIMNSSAICRKGQRAVSVNLSGKKLKAGKYKVTVKAETMDGQKKSSTSDFHVKKLPKSSVSSAAVSLSGGIGTVSFKISEYADVNVTVKSGKTKKQTVIAQAYSAGSIKASFSYGGYKPGTYSVVIKTKNSGGSSTVTKTFKIKKKPVVVKKPTVSGLSVSFRAGTDGDMVQGAFYYTGKNARVVIDIMYNDTEEIVYTYQGVTKQDSGNFSYTWDGFKANGFRCWPGNYTYRVYLVNSAGRTSYLRQNFTLGEG